MAESSHAPMARCLSGESVEDFVERREWPRKPNRIERTGQQRILPGLKSENRGVRFVRILPSIFAFAEHARGTSLKQRAVKSFTDFELLRVFSEAAL
jgi:hypothetical protein